MTQKLNAHIANLIDVSLQIHQAHWNVKGPQFLTLHTLFGDIYGRLDAQIDAVAERISQLGALAFGSCTEVAKASKIDDYPKDVTQGLELAVYVAARLRTLESDAIKLFNQATTAGDHGTADLLVGHAQELAKDRWMVESHVKKS